MSGRRKARSCAARVRDVMAEEGLEVELGEVDVEIQGVGGKLPTVWPLSVRAKAWAKEAIETSRPIELAVGIAPEDMAELVMSAHDAGLRVEIYKLGSEEGTAFQ